MNLNNFSRFHKFNEKKYTEKNTRTYEQIKKFKYYIITNTMDSIPIFVPNFPPPPIHPQSAVPITSAPNSNLYHERLQIFLKSCKNRRLPSSIPNAIRQKPLKLSELSTSFSNFYATIEQMKAEIQQLSESAASVSNHQWDNQSMALKSQLNEISVTSQKYQDPNLRDNAKRAVSKRLKRRSRIKKRKSEFDALKQCALKNRELKQHQIDQWLEKNAEQIREHQRQIENKQRAEEVLAEVKSLKNDATKSIQTFDSLKELYRIRNKGKARDDRDFNRDIEKLKKKWLNAFEKYDAEEKRIRTFVNCSNNLDEWRGTIFGDGGKQADLFSLKKTENGLQKLIEIRRQWDSFIVSDENPYGSSVPLGWAIPNANPTNQWKAYLNQQENNANAN